MLGIHCLDSPLWVSSGCLSTCRDAAHVSLEFEAKIANRISKCLHESPAPPDKHLSGVFKDGKWLAKIKALFFLSLWLLGFVSECLGRQAWEAWGRDLWATRWWWWGLPHRLALGQSLHLYKPQFPHL